MEKKIKLILKNRYGNYRYYPNCEFSRLLLDIAGSKSFTVLQVKHLEKNGFKVEVTPVI